MNPPWLSWDGARPAAGLQGIDHLEIEVLGEGMSPRARLLVFLHQTWNPAQPFTRERFSIRDAGGNEPPWWVEGESASIHQVTLAFPEVGPPQGYTLELRDGGADPVNPFFREARFAFSCECERGDCRPEPEAAPSPSPRQRPAVDLLARDYRGFVGMFAEWVRVHNPHWADLAPASFERVLVELLAHQGDLLSYYQDRVAAEAFLDTATQRYSLRQHAALLGVKLFDGATAETLLAFEVAGSDGFVAAGAEVTTAPGEAGESPVFYVTEHVRVSPPLGVLRVAAWPGAADAEIPAGAEEVLLWGHVADLYPGRRLCFARRGPNGAVWAAHVVRVRRGEHLSLVGWVERPDHAASGARPVTRVTFEPPLPERMAPWKEEFTLFGTLAPARFGALRGETFPLTARAMLGRRVDATVEARVASPNETSIGEPRPLLRALRLSRSPVLFREQRDATERPLSAPEVEVATHWMGGHAPWTRVEHLHDSRSFDRHYVAHLDEDGALWLEFGDGRRGHALELLLDEEAAAGALPEDLVVRYRSGDPIDGNLAAGVLTRFAQQQPPGLPPLPPGLSVLNVLPGVGGRRLERREVARVRVPASLRHGPIERAVTLDDYARAARIPGVARALARSVGGPFNTVLVLVDPEGRNGLPDALRVAVQGRLEALRMTGREVVVRGPDYVPLEVRVALCVSPGADPHKVRAAALAGLRTDARSPLHPDRISFGQSLELGDVLAFVQAVPGVRSVKALRFRKLRAAETSRVVWVLRFGDTEVARLDADPAAPENGTLAVRVVGIDPELHERDFVIEERP